MSWTIFGSSPEMKYQRSSVFISGLGKTGSARPPRRGGKVN
jgi:hypothetical protein